MRTDKLTPMQHGLGAAAAYVGCLAACLAVIYAVIDTGKQTQTLHSKCLEVSSRAYCDLTYFGR